MADDDNIKAPAHKSFLGTGEMFSFGLAAAVTTVTSWFAIGRRFGTNFAELGGGAKELHDKHINKLTELYDAQHASPIDGKAFAHKIAKERSAFETASKAFTEKVGIKNTWHKVIEMKPHQRLEVAFGAIAVFTVSLGAIMGLARSKELMNLFHKQENAQDSQTQRG